MKIDRLAVTISLILVCALASTSWGGFEAGMNAYRKKDFTTAMREFKAAGNVPQANYNIGVMYFRGEGVKQDKKEGAKWFRKAAEQGHAESQFLLSALYFTGDGIEQNTPEGVKWIKKSAAKGFPEAQFRLGMMYINGDNIEKNRDEGLKWVKKAEKQGHQNAKKLLQVMGEKGAKSMPKGHPAVPRQ